MRVEDAIRVGKGSVFFLLAVEAGIGTVVLFVLLLPTGVAAPLIALAAGLALTLLFAATAFRYFGAARASEQGEAMEQRYGAASDAVGE